VPKPDQLLLPASVVGIVVGVALFVGSATATTAAVPPLHTARFTSLPATTTTTTTTSLEPEPVVALPAAEAEAALTATAALETEPEPPAPSPVEQVVAFALAQRGHPYRRSAAGPNAFDCSGLTSAAYATVGVDLPHYSVSQAARGRAVDWHTEAIQAGDLIFVRGDTPVIDLGHVGLAVSATEWVVASRPGVPVRVAPIPPAIQRVRRIFEN
jgi:peptidoglycan DL-endopeptidase CwlO